MRYAEVNDTYHAFYQIKSNMSLHRFIQKGLNVLANDAFTKVDKAVVELQLVGSFIDGL